MTRRRVHLVLGAATLVGALALDACGGGGGGTNVLPTPTPTTSPTLPPTQACGAANPNPTTPPAVTGWQGDLFVGGTPSSTPQSLRRQGSIRANAPERVARRQFRVSNGPEYVPGVIEVTYDRTTFAVQRNELSRMNSRMNATVQSTLDFSAIGKVTQIIHVEPGQEDTTIAQLKSQAGVLNASREVYRHLESTTAAFTNDPYFNGFAPDQSPPAYENTNVPGQWDMHAIFAANAWGYANANSTGHVHAGAAGGSASFPIAIIDTGADLTHPELSNVTYAESDLSGVTTVGMSTMHDDDGHGTNVAGIAAATGNNNLGFAGVAYAAPLMIFKVFPDSGSDAQPSDIGLAITDAVNKGARVISMSLGASGADSAEENAVANAVASNVVVVAAAGNGNAAGMGLSTLDFPAADPGVIAVGASALDDTDPTNAGLKVACYSNYTTNFSPAGGPTYLVAPGGDPCPGTGANVSCNDSDNLHWIENIYSSTAKQAGDCKPDFGNPTGPTDCRVLIAGTSQATPHVAGAAALLLSVGASAASIPALLCDNATQLSAGSVNQSHQGCGQLNVYKAMASQLGDSNFP